MHNDEYIAAKGFVSRRFDVDRLRQSLPIYRQHQARVQVRSVGRPRNDFIQLAPYASLIRDKRVEEGGVFFNLLRVGNPLLLGQLRLDPLGIPFEVETVLSQFLGRWVGLFWVSLVIFDQV